MQMVLVLANPQITILICMPGRQLMR